jgi:hypothetical protein
MSTNWDIKVHEKQCMGIWGYRLTVVGVPPMSVTYVDVRVKRENPLDGVKGVEGGIQGDEEEEGEGVTEVEVDMAEEVEAN